METFYFVALLTAVCAEPPVPEGFAGYERGGYEIQTKDDQKTFPGADQLNFPGVSDVAGGLPSSGGVGVSGAQSLELQVGLPSRQRDGLGAGGERFDQQQRGRGRFEGEEGSLDDIPGVAGKDYPIYGDIPTTSFSCDQQTAPGYYADVETQCQVFHICQKGGQKNSVLCPNGTIFNQKVFVCSWWYDFDCDSAPGLFSLNEQNSEEADAATSRARQGGGSEGGYAETGPNGGEFGVDGGSTIPSRGYTDDGQNFEQGTRDLSEIGINSVSSVGGENTFGGYQENGPRPAKLSNVRNEQNSQNGPNSRFSSIGPNRGNINSDFVGYSENGPNVPSQEENRNDLRTSGRFSGRNGVDTSSSGRAGSSASVEQVNEASTGYPGGRNGNIRDRNGNGNSQGNGPRYEGSSGNGGQQLRDLSSENVGQKGYPGGGRAGVGNNGHRDGQEQSSQYLPPGEGASGPGGFNNEATITTDRSYLPPS